MHCDGMFLSRFKISSLHVTQKLFSCKFVSLCRTKSSKILRKSTKPLSHWQQLAETAPAIPPPLLNIQANTVLRDKTFYFLYSIKYTIVQRLIQRAIFDISDQSRSLESDYFEICDQSRGQESDFQFFLVKRITEFEEKNRQNVLTMKDEQSFRNVMALRQIRYQFNCTSRSFILGVQSTSRRCRGRVSLKFYHH